MRMNFKYKFAILAGFISGGILILSLILLLVRTSPVIASGSLMTDFTDQYPNTAGTRLDSCSVCHTASIPAVNSYGDDYRTQGHSFPAVENMDSDGDGYTNLQEIMALTFPGDINDHPSGSSPTATYTPTPTRVTTATSTPQRTSTSPAVTPTATSRWQRPTRTPVPSATSPATSTPQYKTKTPIPTPTKHCSPEEDAPCTLGDFTVFMPQVSLNSLH
jgi:hypothetical protein